jgi:hypothetical protein
LGGCISIWFELASLVILFQQIEILIERRENIFFNETTRVSHDEEVTDVKIGDYDIGMNFVLGITRGKTPSFDWFDNPYVYPNVYSIDENFKPRLLKDV